MWQIQSHFLDKLSHDIYDSLRCLVICPEMSSPKIVLIILNGTCEIFNLFRRSTGILILTGSVQVVDISYKISGNLFKSCRVSKRQQPPKHALWRLVVCGLDRTWTCYLVSASDALYQVSYEPKLCLGDMIWNHYCLGDIIRIF